MLETVGPAKYQGDKLGRFELVPGEEEGGGPVYQQVHSREIPNDRIYLLYR